MNDFWDDSFHVAAFVAFVFEARRVQDWPDANAVKREAYKIYEARGEWLSL